MTSSVASTNQADFLKYSHTIGLCTMDGRGFMFPSDTAIGPEGRIYTVSRGLVGDSRTQRVTAYDLGSAFLERSVRSAKMRDSSNCPPPLRLTVTVISMLPTNTLTGLTFLTARASLSGVGDQKA